MLKPTRELCADFGQLSDERELLADPQGRGRDRVAAIDHAVARGLCLGGVLELLVQVSLQRLNVPTRVAERALRPVYQFQAGLKERLPLDLAEQVWVGVDRGVVLQERGDDSLGRRLKTGIGELN